MMRFGYAADASIDAALSTPSKGAAVSITAAQATGTAEIAIDGESAACPYSIISIGCGALEAPGDVSKMCQCRD